jgi:hypothetical protein
VTNELSRRSPTSWHGELRHRVTVGLPDDPSGQFLRNMRDRARSIARGQLAAHVSGTEKPRWVCWAFKKAAHADQFSSWLAEHGYANRRECLNAAPLRIVAPTPGRRRWTLEPIWGDEAAALVEQLQYLSNQPEP